jgi:hypothetical protein
MTHRTIAAAAAALLAVAVPADAQSPYVGASFFGDIVRTSHTRTLGVDGGGGGEAIGVAVRAGTPLGAAWGVDLEFAYPSAIDEDYGQRVPEQFAPLLTALPPDLAVSSLLPPYYSVSTRSEQRTSTLSASVWAAQQLTGRLSLVYLGGIGFFRATREDEIQYSPALIGLPIVVPPFETESVSYGVRPLAGMEARYDVGARLQIVPGVRLHGMDNGWTIRPSIGVSWRLTP